MTGGVLVWLAVKAAMAVLAVLVPAIRGGPSVTDPAGLAVPGAADGFFGVLHHWDSGNLLGVASDGYFPAGADSSMQSFFPGYPAIGGVVRSLASPPTVQGRGDRRSVPVPGLRRWCGDRPPGVMPSPRRFPA